MPRGDRSQANEALALHLAKGETIERAAGLAGVSESTVYRRLRTGDFRARVAELRREMMFEAVGVLSSLGREAAETLGELMSDEDSKVRLSAAKAVLDQLHRGLELTDLAEAVRELRERLDGRDASEGGGG